MKGELDSNHDLKQRLTDSRAELVKSFYRAWDPTWAQQQIGSIGQGRGGPELLGEGTSFRCYRLVASASNGGETVLLLGKPSFCRQPRVLKGVWRRAMEVLGRLEHPFLPPFQFLALAEGVAFGMPYCAQVLSPHSRKQLEFREQENELLSLFDQAGLVLKDDWQYRLWRTQHPLLTDYSDLDLKD